LLVVDQRPKNKRKTTSQEDKKYSNNKKSTARGSEDVFAGHARTHIQTDRSKR